MSVPRLRHLALALAATIGVASGCTSTAGQVTPMPDPTPAPGTAVVRGSVSYRDRSALPPDAAMEVWITDVTPGLMLTMAVVAQQRFPTSGRQVPLAFELSYDPARVDPTHRYAIKAAISSGGQMRYSGESEFRPPTGGGPATVSIMVAAPR